MDVDLLHPDADAFPRKHLDDFAEPDGWIVIGVVQLQGGGEYLPVAVKDAGRMRLIAYVRDQQFHEIELDDIGPAVYYAIDEACTKLWGHSWNAAMAELFDLNRRTLQRDRVSRYLLPAKILSTISYIASADDGDELAKMLVAISAYHKRFEHREIVEDYVGNAVRIFYEFNPASKPTNE